MMSAGCDSKIARFRSRRISGNSSGMVISGVAALFAILGKDSRARHSNFGTYKKPKTSISYTHPAF